MDRNNNIIENVVDELYQLFTITDNLNNYVFNNVANQSLYNRNPNKNVVSKETIESLVSINYKDLEEDNTLCSITQERFKEDDSIIQLPCTHCFLREAIEKWLTEESNKCPVCRFTFDSEEKKEIQDDTFFQENIQEQQQELQEEELELVSTNEDFFIIEDRSDLNNIRYRVFTNFMYR